MDHKPMEGTVNAHDYFQYQYLEGVETLERYYPGGYHPVKIDSLLHGRYHIVHKLRLWWLPNYLAGKGPENYQICCDEDSNC